MGKKLKSVDARKHDIQQREIEGVILFKIGCGIIAIFKHFEIVADISEIKGDCIRNALVVLDDD